MIQASDAPRPPAVVAVLVANWIKEAMKVAGLGAARFDVDQVGNVVGGTLHVLTREGEDDIVQSFQFHFIVQGSPYITGP